MACALCRLLAFLREEEERERLEEIERLRPIGTAVGPYMEYRWTTQNAFSQSTCARISYCTMQLAIHFLLLVSHC